MKHHPRIHPVNYSLLRELPADHPAVRALQVQAEARDECVGKEIEWPRTESRAIEQSWFSLIDQRTWTFSGFAYAFISFDLVLNGWLDESLYYLQPFEEDFVHELPRLRELLDECEVQATSDGNDAVLPLILKAREFFDAFEESIIARVGRVEIEPSDRYVESLWGAGRCERFRTQ